MKLAKKFSSNQSMFIIGGLALLLIILFLVFQNSASNLERESIKREQKLNENTQRLLFDLKQTLSSGADRESVTAKSLSIIASIRDGLNSEFIYLRKEAQEKIYIINERINTIEQKVLEGDFEGAEQLTDQLIEDLQESEDIGSFGEDNGGSNSDNESPTNDYDPGFDDSVDDDNTTGGNNGGDDDQDQGDNNGDTGGDDTNTTIIDDGGGNDRPNTSGGTTPSWDRNKYENQPDIIELKIGD